MPRSGRGRRQLGSRFWSADVGKEVDAELAFHIDMTVRELMERGLTREQARAEAERRFGDVALVAARCEQLGRQRDRNASRAEFRTELAHDVTFAVRQLARARGFTIVAMLTLALGIGATAAVFSALYAVVLRSLPFADPERVVAVHTTLGDDADALSVAEYFQMRDHATGFEAIAASAGQVGFTLTDGDVPLLVGGGRVTHDYFTVFGVRPYLGRTFDATEDQPGGAQVVVLSHRFWRSHFGADASIVGRTLHLGGEAHQIIGVMPAAFDLHKESEEIWAPLVLTQADAERTGAHYLAAFARVKDGVTIHQAREQATMVTRLLAARLSSKADDTNNANSAADAAKRGVKLTPYLDTLVGDYRTLLLILLGAVSFVLLIACTNVANLLLARGTSRARELAIRASLGAGRARLVRQLLTESLVLSLSGAALGLGVAAAILRGVRAVSPEDIPRLEHAAVDGPVLAFTLALAIVCTVVFGLVPAIRASGSSLQATLRESGRSPSGGARDRVRGMLVAAEVALAMALLTGAGLLIRSAWLVQNVPPGFDPRGVLTSRIVLPEQRYPDAQSITDSYERIRLEAARIPGVAVAALSSVVPLSGSRMTSSIRAESMSSREGVAANLRLASTGYFTAMGIPLRAGRDLATTDDASAPKVVVINEALARKLWPTDPLSEVLGRRIDAISEKRNVPELREVVGVVGDLHDAALSKPVDPEFYIPVPQTPALFWPFIQRSLVVIVRATDPAIDPVTFRKPLQLAVATVDRSLPVAESRTMTDYIRSSLDRARFNTLLLSMLGAIALVLAMVGVYGVVAHFVSQRTHEIGVRMALGATPKQTWRHVVARGLAPIAFGVAIGLALSALTTGVLRNQLYGVTTTDPGTFVGVGLLLLGVSLVATYVPARRAMSVAPVEALKAS